MACPSLPYLGERGNHKGGGNEYFVLFRDAKSGRLFDSFIMTKDNLEDAVALQTQAMEIAAKDSVDFDVLDFNARSEEGFANDTRKSKEIK